jgi:hypothetical protein
VALYQSKDYSHLEEIGGCLLLVYSQKEAPRSWCLQDAGVFRRVNAKRTLLMYLLLLDCQD